MAAKTHNARPIMMESEFQSQVDIIVPFHGQYHLVTKLLDSIFRLTRSNYYQLILVDDCSPNPVFLQNLNQNLQKNADRSGQNNILKTIRTESQLGYAGACRIGYNEGESPYVCFLNSDCKVQTNSWLRNMGESLLKLKTQDVRVIGPTTNNPVGGDPAQFGTKIYNGDDDVIISDDSFLTLPCFMCHRELFFKIGGFLKEYGFGGYEDEEFAHRLKSYGFKQAVCKSSYVDHIGGVTMTEVMRRDPNGAGLSMDINRQQCIKDMKLLSKKV